MTLTASRAAAALAALVALLVAGLPGTARAEVAPTVRWAGSVNDDLGVLQVSATSDSDIVQLTAHIVSYTTGQEVAAVDDFVLRSGTRQDGEWVTPQPLVLAELAQYRVDVEATDADGDHTTAGSIGSLVYLVQAVLAPLTTNRTTVDINHRDVTVRGRLTGRWPTREVRPLAGLPVALEVDYWEVRTVQTGRDGTFSGVVTLTGAARVQAVYRFDNSRPTILSGESEPVEIGIVRSATRLTAVPSATRVPEGGSFTVTGQLTWKSGGVWRPLAGADIGVLLVPGGGGQSEPVGVVTTGADGRYTVTATPYDSGTVQLTWTSDDPFKADASRTTAVVHVAHSSAINSFTAVRAAGRTVEVAGGVVFPGSFTPPAPTLDVEFSRTGSGWSRVATRDAYWDGMTYGFTDTFTERRAGYWRLHYRGGPDFQAAVSDPIFVPAA